MSLDEKILIANRGEIAIRIMDACKDLGVDYAVIYTDSDKDSEHVRKNITSGAGQNAWKVTSYTDPNDLLAVADHAQCTAIHPGYGFFSEDYRFARRVTARDRALTFIGPNWKVIRDLGDKINTKRIAKSLGIPIIPGTSSPIYNEMEAEEIAVDLLDGAGPASSTSSLRGSDAGEAGRKRRLNVLHHDLHIAWWLPATARPGRGAGSLDR